MKPSHLKYNFTFLVFSVSYQGSTIPEQDVCKSMKTEGNAILWIHSVLTYNGYINITKRSKKQKQLSSDCTKNLFIWLDLNCMLFNMQREIQKL